MLTSSLVILFLGSALAQRSSGGIRDETKTEVPPVAINKFINQQNNDGSYTYGFEGADGTFRLETRDQQGNVQGKYGYYDANNELKVVEYTAGNKAGFEAKADFLPQPQQPIHPDVPTHDSVRHSAQPSRNEAPRGSDFSQGPPPQRFSQQSASHEDPRGGQTGGRQVFPVSSPVFNIETPVFQPRPHGSQGEAQTGGQVFDGTYVPSIALEGFSEDKDKDGFVDAIPSDGSIPARRQQSPAPPSITQFSAPGQQHARPQQDFHAQSQFPASQFGSQQFNHPPQQFQQQQQPAQFAPPGRFFNAPQGAPIFRSTSPQAFSPAFGQGGFNGLGSPVSRFPSESSDAIPSIPDRTSAGRFPVLTSGAGQFGGGRAFGFPGNPGHASRIPQFSARSFQDIPDGVPQFSPGSGSHRNLREGNAFPGFNPGFF